MNNFKQKTNLFFKKNGSTILTGFGVAGVFATAVSSAISTPKAIKLIAMEKESKGEELTKIEKIKVAAPAYIPTALIALSTIFCVCEANHLNRSRQAMLASAYTLLDSSYKEYKEKVKELYGESGSKEVERKIMDEKFEGQNLPEDDDRTLFFDNNSMRFFRSTIEEVTNAEIVVNETLASTGYSGLDVFYDVLGLPVSNVEKGLGWSLPTGNYFYGYAQINFKHEKVRTKDGHEYYVIATDFEPTADYLFL